MNPSDRMEIDALREEQARLRRTLDLLDRRLAAFDLRVSAVPRAEPPPVPQSPPAPAPVAPLPAVAEHVPESAPLPLPGPVLSAQAKEPAAPPASRAAAPAESIELKLGTYWLARIGIVILLTGFVFLGNYAYHHIVPHLGALGKLALLSLAGLALAAGAYSISSPRAALARAVVAVLFSARGIAFAACSLDVVHTPILTPASMSSFMKR